MSPKTCSSWRHSAADEDATNDFLHGDCITVTGRTIAENLTSVKWNEDQDVVRRADKPMSPTGGVVGLKGNLAPDGAIVKVAGMESLRFSGPARCFDGEEACFDAVKNKKYREGDVLVIRYEGPKGGPGMREMWRRRPPSTAGHGRQGGADHRRTLLGRDPRVLRRPYRAGGGGRTDCCCATATSSRSTAIKGRSTSS
jgi:hypothetical protein